MEQRNLGQSGLAVSLVGLGCNNFAGRIDFEATRAVVHKALDLGITLFDNADTYGERGGAEEYLGRILGARRKDIVLATKFGRPMDAAGRLQGASRRYIMDACEASLKRLQTDYIDLYWQHIEDPLHPAGRDHARVRRPRAPGQGALHRLLDADRVAGGRGELDRPVAGPRPIHRLPGALQPVGARIRAEHGGDGRGLRARADPVLAAGERAA